MTAASLTQIARRFLGVMETQGPNRGFWVSWFQRFSHGVEGESWCADFVSFVLDVAYKGKPPIRRSRSTQEMLGEARAKGFLLGVPKADTLFFYVHPTTGLPHHVGIVTDVRVVNGEQMVTGIAGNTSPDGTSSNGTGVFEHSISTMNVVYVSLPHEVKE